MSISLRPNMNHSVIIRKANHCLLYKDFDRCLEICLKGIGATKNFPEHDGSAQTIEALCVLATQAYAELNRWQEVLPLITQLYNGIEDCPARVVQLCVLLHAHMRDFTTCGAIAHIWLRNPNNAGNPQYTKLIEIFIVRILQRQDRLTDVPAFLDSCSGLSQIQKDAFKKYAKSQEHEQGRVGKLTSIEKQEKCDNRMHKMTKDNEEEHGLLNTICKAVSRIIPPVAWLLVKRIALLSIFIYWVCTQANFELLSNKRVVGIFAAILRLWRSMFAPYHVAK